MIKKAVLTVRTSSMSESPTIGAYESPALLSLFIPSWMWIKNQSALKFNEASEVVSTTEPHSLALYRNVDGDTRRTLWKVSLAWNNLTDLPRMDKLCKRGIKVPSARMFWTSSRLLTVSQPIATLIISYLLSSAHQVIRGST